MQLTLRPDRKMLNAQRVKDGWKPNEVKVNLQVIENTPHIAALLALGLEAADYLPSTGR